MKWLKKIDITSTVRELILVAGFLLLGYGIWIVYQPASYTVCGALLMWVGLPPRRKGGD